LRERKEDIPLLTDYFIGKYHTELHIEKTFKLSGDLRKLFQVYHWPGNVRELSSIILRLMVGDHPEAIKNELLSNMKEDGLVPPQEFIPEGSEETQANAEILEPGASNSLKHLKAVATNYIEKKAITHALNMTGWNKRQAARLLKISYKALFYKMDNLGIAK
jgi:DNA-binding NtrC family response regulator